MANKAKKKKEWNIAIGIAIVLIIIILVFRKNDKEETSSSSTSGSGGSSASSGTTLKSVGNNGVLKYGVKAVEVKYIQDYYNKKIAVPLNKTKLVVDGIFGSKTQAVVQTITAKNWTTWTEFKNKIDQSLNPGTGSTGIYTSGSGSNSEFDWEYSPY